MDQSTLSNHAKERNVKVKSGKMYGESSLLFELCVQASAYRCHYYGFTMQVPDRNLSHVGIWRGLISAASCQSSRDWTVLVRCRRKLSAMSTLSPLHVNVVSSNHTAYGYVGLISFFGAVPPPIDRHRIVYASIAVAPTRYMCE